MHFSEGNPDATFIADLTNFDTLPENKFDCFILTQTLNFIYDYKKAIDGLFFSLAPKGVGLITVGGISQISRYDMDRWGDFWRFTDLSIKMACEDIFGKGRVEVFSYGNILSAISFLEGISAEELTNEELFYNDNDYQILLGIKVVKDEM